MRVAPTIALHIGSNSNRLSRTINDDDERCLPWRSDRVWKNIKMRFFWALRRSWCSEIIIAAVTVSCRLCMPAALLSESLDCVLWSRARKWTLPTRCYRRRTGHLIGTTFRNDVQKSHKLHYFGVTSDNLVFIVGFHGAFRSRLRPLEVSLFGICFQFLRAKNYKIWSGQTTFRWQRWRLRNAASSVPLTHSCSL